MESEDAGRTDAPCVYVEADPFSWRYFAGIPRYAARLAMALAERARVRFFHDGKQITPLPGIDWSQDGDIERWARHVWHGERSPLRPEPNAVGLYCGTRPEARIFSYEVSILHDLCPMLVGWSFPEAARIVFTRYYTRNLLSSDLVLADSHSTKADAAWLLPMPQDRMVVAQAGMSLCVDNHMWKRRVKRSLRIGLAVSTVEPRKNAGFLLEWFHESKQLPRDMELWWAGRVGWMTTRKELRRMSRPPGGRRVRFLGHVSDAELCRLYRRASWSIYPSLYEGFGFPVVDSLRHGTPVLTSRNSSLREFTHEGVSFFDPRDPATVDVAWKALRENPSGVIDAATLLDRYDWRKVAGTILKSHADFQAGSVPSRDLAA